MVIGAITLALTWMWWCTSLQSCLLSAHIRLLSVVILMTKTHASQTTHQIDPWVLLSSNRCSPFTASFPFGSVFMDLPLVTECILEEDKPTFFVLSYLLSSLLLLMGCLHSLVFSSRLILYHEDINIEQRGVDVMVDVVASPLLSSAFGLCNLKKNPFCVSLAGQITVLPI